MLYLVESGRTYDPETITVMTAAFDEACRSLSAPMNSNDDVRRRLAAAILQCVDQGERDPAIIAAAAMSQLPGVSGPRSDERPPTEHAAR